MGARDPAGRGRDRLLRARFSEALSHGFRRRRQHDGRPRSTGGRAVRVIVTLAELLGGLALILGLFTRLAAISLGVGMLVATLTVHLPNGFSVLPNGGYEFTLVLLATSVALAVGGPGEAALDRFLATRTNNPALARLTR